MPDSEGLNLAVFSFLSLKKNGKQEEKKEKQGIEKSSEETTEYLKRKLPELQRQCYRKQKLNVSWSLLPMRLSKYF